MKTMLVLILLAVLIGGSLLWAQDSQSDQQKIEALQARLQKLEQRVVVLEQKVETHYVALPSNGPLPPNTTFPSTQVPAGQKPPGKPFEFNGQTYYLMPLKGNQ